MSVWETLDRHTDATKVAEALEKAGVPPPQQAERSITEQRALAWEMFFATGSDASDDDSTQYRIAGDPITPGAALDAVAALREGSELHVDSLLKVLKAGARALTAEPSVLDLAAASDVYVVGDLHGSMPSLAEAVELCGPMGDGRCVVFNGDFVDRGSHSTEVLASVLLLKLAMPTSAHLLRGNHEDTLLSAAYGFKQEVEDKYKHSTISHEQLGPGDRHPPDSLWGAIASVYAALPIAATTESALIVHGGLPSAEMRLETLQRLSAADRALPSVLPSARPSAASAEVRIRERMSGLRRTGSDVGARGEGDVQAADSTHELIQGLVWSDPDVRIRGVRRNEPRGGAGYLFGPDVAEEWLRRHGMRDLVRSHQVVERGWERLACGGGDNSSGGDSRGGGDGDATSVWTVFSSACYPNGEGDNIGAVLRLRPGATPEPIEFRPEAVSACASGGREAAEPREATAEASEAASVRSLGELVLRRRHRLREAFEAIGEGGRVSVEQWAIVMERELGLELPWLVLQPELADRVKRASQGADGTYTISESTDIDFNRFLERYAVQASERRARSK